MNIFLFQQRRLGVALALYVKIRVFFCLFCFFLFLRIAAAVPGGNAVVNCVLMP